MEKIAKLLFVDRLKLFFLLTKPGIIFGNSLTALGGFALAFRGKVSFSLFFALFQGLILVIASACVYNNLIDRALDQKMVRTQNRPLPRGLIAPRTAFFFATFLGGIGSLILALYTNLLTLILTLAGHFLYVFAYSFAKYKTSYGTWIGALSGAIPPVVGYTAISNQIDLAALLLFFMIIFWQMPHFYAIAIFRLEDYAQGEIPVMPIRKGMPRTKLEMTACCFALTATLGTFACVYAPNVWFFSVLIGLAMSWWIFSIQGFRCLDDKKWAQKMFLFSLIIVTVLSVLLPLSTFPRWL